MWRDKSPGLKILWLWTFGTAAVLVTNVVRTRMRDMEHLINAEDQTRSDSNGDDSVPVGILSSDAAGMVSPDQDK